MQTFVWFSAIKTVFTSIKSLHMYVYVYGNFTGKIKKKHDYEMLIKSSSGNYAYWMYQFKERSFMHEGRPFFILKITYVNY